MSDFAQKPATGEAPASANAPAGKPATNAPAFVGIAGTLIVLAVAGLVAMKSDLFTEAGSASAPIVSFVDQRDIDAASSTLNPSVAGGLVDEAKRCKIPLASITIARGTAQLGSTLRIRAGNYVSPYFSITDNMQRIALPYPAPYGAGAGIMSWKAMPRVRSSGSRQPRCFPICRRLKPFRSYGAPRTLARRKGR